MRELVHLQIGQCGNQIGSMFWEKLNKEHHIGPNGQCLKEFSKMEEDRLAVYYGKVGENRFVPRAILIDLESGTSEAIKKSQMAELFRPDNYIHAFNGAGNNFAKGFYTEGAELIEAVLDRVRKETEECESLQGFQVCHSAGGGTGSGLGSRVISSLHDDFSDKIISAFTVFPSAKVSDVVVEPYNATLSLNHLVESSSACFCQDNEALYNICTNGLKIESPSYEDLNKVVSEAIVGITGCVRFPGQLNSDFRKLAVNLTPFPRLHFFIDSVAPITSTSSQAYRSLSVPEIINEMFDARNMMTACDPSKGKYFAVATLFRGNVSSKDAEDHMINLHKKYENLFVSWIPNNVLTASTDVARDEIPASGTFIGNSTSIMSLHQRILDSCSKMLERKAFLHWYTDEGMEVSEISESIGTITDLIEEYKIKENF